MSEGALSMERKTPSKSSMKGLMLALGKKEKIEAARKIGQLHELVVKREVGGTMAAAVGRRTAMGVKPLAIEGMEFIEFVTLDLRRDFDSLEVDPRYQRGEQKTVVNSLAVALRAGGLVLAPIVLARRRWRDEHTKPRVKWYLVDGQQRVLAHMSAEVFEVNAVIYESSSLDAEMRAFSILNATAQKVSGNAIVRSFGGPVTTYLRECDDDAAHPLHRRIQWATAGNVNLTSNIGALMTIKGIAFATKVLSPGASVMTPSTLIPKLDAKFDRRKTDAFLRILAKCVRAGGLETRAVNSFVIALGQVCAEKWEKAPLDSPTPAQCATLSRIEWVNVTRHSVSLDMLPVVRERIKKVWK